ncbi:MAG: queuosine salvage family protein [Candidatus Heimdallarchaeaceae archaeon]
MDLVNSVFETAEKFTKNPRHVFINDKELELVANDMKLEKPKDFPKQIDTSDQFKACLLELIGDSINYCYWYGSASIRPGGSSSGKMFDMVEMTFENYTKDGGVYSIDRCLDDLIKILSLERFPLLEKRIKHLNELRLNGQKYVETLIKHKDANDVDFFMNAMVQIFPGYASDIFLKRACLFFAQLNRKFGWFEEDMHKLPVPADYQVPKMLEQYRILIYEDELQAAIDDEVLIAKGSIAECEIRASTIIACKQLCEKTDWTMPQVDGYFWLRRKEATNPFHLTVTSDY